MLILVLMLIEIGGVYDLGKDGRESGDNDRIRRETGEKKSDERKGCRSCTGRGHWPLVRL